MRFGEVVVPCVKISFRRLSTLLIALSVFSIPSVRAQAKADQADQKKAQKEDKDREEQEPRLTVTEHTVTIGGKPVKYKATAGYMVLKDYSPKPDKKKDLADEDGFDEHSDKEDDKGGDKKDKKDKPKPLAKVFFIAYTRENAGAPGKRPVTFCFNGGPGSASVWLHMGALGPRRAVLTDRGEALPPPYRLEDNNFSWLDDSDLVFIDPVSTGYSRPENDVDAKKFHGYKEDIESVGEFVRLYTTKFERWTSPKFVAGESYGTTRAAGLSDFLQSRYGIYLNGIVLVSSVLNFETLDFAPGNDLPYALFTPTYAAAAWYHKKIAPDLQSQPLPDVLKQAEAFASHDDLLALFQGDKISPDTKKEIAAKLARFIGLPADYISQLNLRIPSRIFFTHLLMDRNRQIGRYDSRFSGIRYRPGTDQPDFDPSDEAVNGPFTATFNDYVRRELHFESELPYETIANVRPWMNAENRYLNVAEDLRKAMSRNPYLKVWVVCGHYDLATPYFAAQYNVNQMELDPSIRDNIRLTYYESGHMVYIYKPALEKLKADFITFVKDATMADAAAVPSAEP
jgi:carboxypeptidase C (cathepsin A)